MSSSDEFAPCLQNARINAALTMLHSSEWAVYVEDLQYCDRLILQSSLNFLAHCVSLAYHLQSLVQLSDTNPLVTVP